MRGHRAKIATFRSCPLEIWGGLAHIARRRSDGQHPLGTRFGVEWVELGRAMDTVPVSGMGAGSGSSRSHPPHGGSLMARMHWLGFSFLGLTLVGCVPQEKYNAARLAL